MANDGVWRFQLETDYPEHAADLVRKQAAYDLAFSRAMIAYANVTNDEVRKARALVDCAAEYEAYTEAKAVDTQHAVTMNCLHVEMTAKYHDFNSKSWREREQD